MLLSEKHGLVRDTEVHLVKEREQIDVTLVSIGHHWRRADRVA